MISNLENLFKKLSFIENFENETKDIEHKLSKLYDYYINQDKISRFAMSMSLENASFLYFFVRNFKPSVLFDMGSGFSTVVFNEIAQLTGSIVYTIDTSDEWLYKTRDFINTRSSKNIVNYVEWKDFDKLITDKKSNLIFYDLYGKDGTRDILYETIVINQPNSVYLLDDMHRELYDEKFSSIDVEYNRELYTLKNFTIDRLNRFMGLSIPSDFVSK